MYDSETGRYNLLSTKLIFRYAHNISDMNLRNIMVNGAGDVLSVDEMSGNRSNPRKVTSIKVSTINI